jgi:hypothetical protein
VNEGKQVWVESAPGYADYAGIEIARIRSVDDRLLSVVVSMGDQHMAIHPAECTREF